jgi:hypothetical protein
MGKQQIILPLKPKFGNIGHILADKMKQAEARLIISQEAVLENQWLITQWLQREKDYNERQKA